MSAPDRAAPRVVWVTNDLPPRPGGIERFVGALLERVHPTTTTVLGPSGPPGAEAHDATVPYRVVRAPSALVPTPRVGRWVVDRVRALAPDVVVLGAAWPLAELVPAIRRTWDVPVIGITHGLEAGMVRVGLAPVLRRALRRLDLVTTISDFTASALGPPLAGVRTARVPPGVDVTAFRAGLDGRAVRRAWGVPDDAPLVGLVSRLVPRKGQDVLLTAWPHVLAKHPEAWLVLAGEGPSAARLERRRAALGPAGRRVVLPGAVPPVDLPSAWAALDVAAFPCRTRWGGLDVEGLGIVTLEAQAVGRPVVVGSSGGAPEALAGPTTGTVVDGRTPGDVAAAVSRWLGDPAARAGAAVAGPAWVAARWSWSAIAERFAALLEELAAGSAPTP